MTEFLQKYALVLAGIALTVVCWGAYGAVLHKGGHHMNETRLKPLICVGGAYFVVAIVIPVLLLAMKGSLQGDWTVSGVFWSSLAGAAGALGALGVTLALSAGGKTAPIYVMPVVFGAAPVVNVVTAMFIQRGFSVGATLGGLRQAHPVFYSGIFMVVLGAALVLVFKPGPPAGKGPSHGKHEPAAETTNGEQEGGAAKEEGVDEP